MCEGHNRFMLGAAFLLETILSVSHQSIALSDYRPEPTCALQVTSYWEKTVRSHVPSAITRQVRVWTVVRFPGLWFLFSVARHSLCCCFPSPPLLPPRLLSLYI